MLRGAKPAIISVQETALAMSV